MSFQIKTFLNEHICSRGFKNKMANRKWVVEKLEDKIRCHPTLTHIEAFEYLKRDFGVHCDESKIFRSLKKARELVEGCERLQYGKIWDYAHELLRSNPGSTVRINILPTQDGPPQFRRIYICLDGCKRGFKAGCRPLIGLDGCFLKVIMVGSFSLQLGRMPTIRSLSLHMLWLMWKTKTTGCGSSICYMKIWVTMCNMGGTSYLTCKRYDTLSMQLLFCLSILHVLGPN